MKLTNATVPTPLLEAGTGEFETVDITVDGDRIALVEPATGEANGDLDCGGGVVVPAFVDMHAHLDSGHIIARAPNPDGTFRAALDAVMADRTAHWTADDLRTRMNFALRSAYACGTAAIRTHLNSRPPVDAVIWPVFHELKAEWADRLTLQAVALVAIDAIGEDVAALFDTTTKRGGLVGAFLYPTRDVPEKVAMLLRHAEDRGVDLDFHVDETLDPTTDYLGTVAREAKRIGFSGTITCGHCCSLMTMEDAKADRILDLAAEADLAIVSLPMCNQYLQHRDPSARRTPRTRGGTLVHEMASRGIRVAIASDNTRDPFYAYGDLDMVEVWREATRVLQLDHPVGNWPRAFSATPAAIMGLPDRDALAPGAPADLVVFGACNYAELFARPQTDRTIIRSGAVVDAQRPDFAELDGLRG